MIKILNVTEIVKNECREIFGDHYLNIERPDLVYKSWDIEFKDDFYGYLIKYSKSNITIIRTERDLDDVKILTINRAAFTVLEVD